MDMQTTKLKLMQLLLNTQKESVLSQLNEVFEKEKARENMVRKDMVESTERANEDIESGRVYTPEEVEKQLEKRFGEWR